MAEETAHTSPTPTYGRVLGTRLDVTNYDDVLQRVIELAETDKVTLVAAANSHLVAEALDHRDFAAALESFDIVMPDGMPLVCAGESRNNGGSGAKETAVSSLGTSAWLHSCSHREGTMMGIFSPRKLAAALASGVIATSALVAGTAGTASATQNSRAAAARSAGSIKTWVTGMPSHVRRGSTVTFTVWFRLHTHQKFVPTMFGTDMGWSGHWQGVSVQFYDQATHHWERPLAGPPGDDHLYQPGGAFGAITWNPGALGHVTYRMHFGAHVGLGHWWIDGSVVGVLLASNATPDESMKVTGFTITR